MVKKSEQWDTVVSTQIPLYNQIKGSSKGPESFKNCIVRFKILVFTSKACFSDPDSRKCARVESVWHEGLFIR